MRPVAVGTDVGPGAYRAASQPGLGIPQGPRRAIPGRSPHQRCDCAADPARPTTQAGTAERRYLLADIPACLGDNLPVGVRPKRSPARQHSVAAPDSFTLSCWPRSAGSCVRAYGQICISMIEPDPCCPRVRTEAQFIPGPVGILGEPDAHVAAIQHPAVLSSPLHVHGSGVVPRCAIDIVVGITN